MTSLGQAILLSSTVVKQANHPITSSPTLVLIHGLDSTRFTWNPFIERCAGKYNIVALDLRGHGESSLGDHPIASFSAAAIAADVRYTLQSLDQLTAPFVLVGHSMGGRIAMQYGADYPEDLAALVIEDMDIKPRSVPPLDLEDKEARRLFNANRTFSTWEEMKKNLSKWYAEARIDGWRVDGRIYEREDGNGWYSGINPLAQFLALERVLGPSTSGGVGIEEWKKCVHRPFPLYLFVAERGSAVQPDSMEEMLALATSIDSGEEKSSSSGAQQHVNVKVFQGASHSIHNTSPDNEFDKSIGEIMRSLNQESR